MIPAMIALYFVSVNTESSEN